MEPRHYLLGTIFPLLLAGCGTLQVNLTQSAERREQANDSLTQTQALGRTILRATTVATLRQPVTSTKTGLAIIWNRSKQLVRSNITLHDEPKDLPWQRPGTPEFERLLDRKGLQRTFPGKLEYLIDGAFFDAYQREVAKARHHVDVQIFIFDNDDIGVHCADQLKRKSNQPETRVRVMFDDLGTSFASGTAPETPAPRGFTPPADMADYLEKNSKVRARRTLNPWLMADHTKLLLFDRQVAMLGGMNLGREYKSEWHDLMVRVEGPITAPLQREFNRAWRKAGPWGDFALFRTPERWRPASTTGGAPLRILRTDAAEGRQEILAASLLAIRASKRRIWIENPYFASDEIKDAVCSAAKRGVDVRVILPSRGDSNIMDHGNLASAGRLLECGVKVFRYPKMTHMKVMLCDDWATLGSANLDTLSLHINRELNLAFNDPALIRELENKVFRPDLKRSQPVNRSEVGRWFSPIAESIADQL